MRLQPHNFAAVAVLGAALAAVLGGVAFVDGCRINAFCLLFLLLDFYFVAAVVYGHVLVHLHWLFCRSFVVRLINYLHCVSLLPSAAVRAPLFCSISFVIKFFCISSPGVFFLRLFASLSSPASEQQLPSSLTPASSISKKKL